MLLLSQIQFILRYFCPFRLSNGGIIDVYRRRWVQVTSLVYNENVIIKKIISILGFRIQDIILTTIIMNEYLAKSDTNNTKQRGDSMLILNQTKTLEKQTILYYLLRLYLH